MVFVYFIKDRLYLFTNFLRLMLNTLISYFDRKHLLEHVMIVVRFVDMIGSF